MWLPEASLQPAEMIAEFDQWVTPSLGEIRSTDKFAEQMNLLEGVLALIAQAHTQTGDVLAALERVVGDIVTNGAVGAAQTLNDLFSVLFLVTAKSDNAAKCQYPIWRRRSVGDVYPVVRQRAVSLKPVPNTLKSEDVARTVAAIATVDARAASHLASSYMGFLLADDEDRAQLDILLHAHRGAEAYKTGGGRKLLSPLVAFQVRGSVAASGGHEPEAIVRNYLDEWGFHSPEHFNTADVVAGTLATSLIGRGDRTVTYAPDAIQAAMKTRAFDVVVPYQALEAPTRILVQSQFYAGDSGSVSHKNVDQARGARASALEIFPTARFVELVDGAGYCASLRKDLQHLLFASDTYDFFQIRSIPVRLRRILQVSGIVTPLEVALLVEAGDSELAALRATVRPRTPSDEHAESAIQFAIDEGWIDVSSADRLSVVQRRQHVVAKYAQLDRVIAAARPLGRQELSGALIVPGYGANFGVPNPGTLVDDVDEDWFALEVVEVLP